MRCFFSGHTTGMSLHRCVIRRICSGVVPQHPPTTTAPMAAISSMTRAKPSASMSYTVFPFSLLGRPALGFTSTGREDTLRISSRIPFICTGPRPQLIPRASTLSPSNRATVDSTFPPVKSFPFSSNITVANTGRRSPVSGLNPASLAASTAAFSS